MDDLVAAQAAIATDLEAFDARIMERGWMFDEDESDEEFVFWSYQPSATEVDGDDIAPVTTIWMSAAEDAQIVHLMLVGTSQSPEFTPDEFFEHIETIEGYRVGEARPDFG